MSTSKKRQAEDIPVQPKPKKSKKRKANAPDDELLDTELGLNTLFTKMDNQLLADHLAQKLGRFGTDLSAVEISDMTVSANAIQDTTSWQESRTLDKFPDFLEKVSEDPEGLKKAPKKKGSPHTLIVAGAGLRAADIVRSMRKFQSKDNSVAKLFAKHMKVEEQVKFLQNHNTGICVGTPARLMDLIDNGALSLDNLKRLVVDASHIDQKKRGVMDMKDTMMPLARFLSRKEFKDRYGDEKKPLAFLDTPTPECATTCSRELMHYHDISTTEGLCHEMAVQRELFSCLASTCTDQYGQALTHAISVCSHHGASISNLLPVELQYRNLATRQFMPLVSRSDSASFGFENHFSLSVDCKAGSDGVLTLSLPESTLSVNQPIPNNGGFASSGAGNSNPNAASSPSRGAPDSNNGPLPGNTAGPGDGQDGTKGGTGPGGGNGDGAGASDPNVDYEDDNSKNGPPQSGNNEGQHVPAPVPPNPPTNNDSSQNGQPGGPPPNPADDAASGPSADDGNHPPGNPDQGTPAQPQPQPAPAPVNPDGGDKVPDQNGDNGSGEDCDDSVPPAADANSPRNSPARPLSPNTDGPVDCSINVHLPMCASYHPPPPPQPPFIPVPPPVFPPAAPAPAPTQQPPAPESSTPQSPSTVPGQGSPPCGDGVGVPSCPASNQPPNTSSGDVNKCSNTDADAGCGSSEPTSPQSPPQPAPPTITTDCSGGEDSPCRQGGDEKPKSGSGSPGDHIQDIPVGPGSPPLPFDIPPAGSGGGSCSGKSDSCPGNVPVPGNAPPLPAQVPSGNGSPSSPGTPQQANPPIPASPPSPPAVDQVPKSPQGNGNSGQAAGSPDQSNVNGGSEGAGAGNDHGDAANGGGDHGSEEPGTTAPVDSDQLPGSPVQAGPPQPTDSNSVGGHEGPQVITVIMPTQIESTATKVMTV
ncbi:hypothetical protein FBEOM_7618 [Fusarium beomiforme]|uniref:Uncharacterized protein n=1 Tax=Fusarium beomiforme TaxID=44412 RepID=A0A9P5DXZ8_9HYPO|nr:hypothetical protein FBEOM_7618 [Fusarium beomiforme]